MTGLRFLIAAAALSAAVLAVDLLLVVGWHGGVKLWTSMRPSNTQPAEAAAPATVMPSLSMLRVLPQENPPSPPAAQPDAAVSRKSEVIAELPVAKAEPRAGTPQRSPPAVQTGIDGKAGALMSNNTATERLSVGATTPMMGMQAAADLDTRPTGSIARPMDKSPKIKAKKPRRKRWR